MLKALITDYEYDSIDLEREMFAKAGIELAEGQRRTSEQLIPAVRDADGVIVQYAEITRGVIAAMERCRVIVKYGIGINNIDADAATEKGIFVCNVPDYGVDEVSNHAIALMLALARKLYRTDRDLRRGIWDYKRLVPISRFEGSSVGIVGFGRMGQAVARKLGAFGVRLQAFDPYFNEKAGAELQVARTDLDTLIRTSDYITLHCPATAENNGLFGEEAFAKMKPTACLINTTRGTVVAQGALVRALGRAASLPPASMFTRPNRFPRMIRCSRWTTSSCRRIRPGTARRRSGMSISAQPRRSSACCRATGRAISAIKKSLTGELREPRGARMDKNSVELLLIQDRIESSKKMSLLMKGIAALVFFAVLISSRPGEDLAYGVDLAVTVVIWLLDRFFAGKAQEGEKRLEELTGAGDGGRPSSRIVYYAVILTLITVILLLRKAGFPAA